MDPEECNGLGTWLGCGRGHKEAYRGFMGNILENRRDGRITLRCILRG